MTNICIHVCVHLFVQKNIPQVYPYVFFFFNLFHICALFLLSFCFCFVSVLFALSWRGITPWWSQQPAASQRQCWIVFFQHCFKVYSLLLCGLVCVLTKRQRRRVYFFPGKCCRHSTLCDNSCPHAWPHFFFPGNITYNINLPNERLRGTRT